MSLATVADYYSCDGSPSIVNLDITIASSKWSPILLGTLVVRVDVVDVDKWYVVYVVVHLSWRGVLVTY